MAIFGLKEDDKKVAKAKKTDEKKNDAKKDSAQDNDAAAVLAELEEKEKNSDSCAFC